MAILNWEGTIPVLKERVKMWSKGFNNTGIVCLTKLVEIPVWSGVFLSSNNLVASSISFPVRTLSLNLKALRFWTIRSVGHLLEGLISWTVLLAIFEKNSLKWQAIFKGSLVSVPFTERWEISLVFLVLFCMAENKICQVLRRFFWFSNNCFWMNCFFAFFMTWL